MSHEDKILQVAKEVVVKFIEVGRVSPAGFAETFRDVYQGVYDAVESMRKPVDPPEPGD
ncbi:MAG: hypothetical protein KKA60_11760 [Proteobacteria bacterium]|nr:hypothetical protein [Pseudomonadota bacterium]